MVLQNARERQRSLALVRNDPAAIRRRAPRPASFIADHNERHLRRTLASCIDFKHSVPNRRNSQVPSPTSRFRDPHPAYRGDPVALLPQRLPHFPAPRRQPRTPVAHRDGVLRVPARGRRRGHRRRGGQSAPHAPLKRLQMAVGAAFALPHGTAPLTERHSETKPYMTGGCEYFLIIFMKYKSISRNDIHESGTRTGQCTWGARNDGCWLPMPAR